jgi:hypothetical protein
MKKKLRIIIPLFVPLLSIVYGIGDYASWWDNLRGRKLALQGVNRLASPSNYPDIIIFNDETEFKYLYSFIISKTENQDVLRLNRKGIKPTAIVRVGGTLKPDVGDNLPDGWPNPKFVPDSSPVVLAYNYSKPPRAIKSENFKPVSNLGEVRQWISDSRNSERFFVATILIGILSVVIVFLDITKDK